MRRIDGMKILAKLRRDEPVILGVGYQLGEMYSLGDHDLNLGMVNLPYPGSLAMGLALALPDQKIISSEGDGSAMSGLSNLCTIGLTAPKNLIRLVWDNEAWGAPGHSSAGHMGPFPTGTGTLVNLEAIARATGIQSACTVRTEGQFEEAMHHALTEPGPHLIVAKVDTSTLDYLPPVPYGITECTARFRRGLINRGWVNPWHSGATIWKNQKFEFGSEGRQDQIRASMDAIQARLEPLMPKATPRLSVPYARTIYESLKMAGINMFVYLPDSANYFIQRFGAEDPDMMSISVTREDEGMAIAMGGFMGGKSPCIIMEASGIGLCYLALAWMGIQQRLATLILTSHTDGLGETTDYHVCTRYLAEPLLRGMGIPHHTLLDVADAPRLIKYACMTVRGHSFPVAIQLPRQVLWEDPE